MVVIVVEVVNLAVLSTNHTIMDIIMNFLALVVIAEFDDFFFLTVDKEVMADLICDGNIELYYGVDRKLSDLLTFERSTSGKARYKVEGNRIEVDEIW